MTFPIGITIPPHIGALLFDLDGTLVDNMHLHIEAWINAGNEFGVEVTQEMININAGIPTRQLIEKLAFENDWNVDFDKFTTFKQTEYKRVKREAGPIKKIEPIIEIADYYRGIMPMTVGTGSSRSNAIGALEDAGILSWFDLVVSADDVSHPKPHPEVFLKGAAHIGVRPEHCLVFEDGDKGIESAKSADMEYVDVRLYL